jgi:hypothetical protein
VGAASAAKRPKIFPSWLAFFKANWPALRHEYNLRQQRRLQTCGALELAHQHARELPGGLSDQGALALSALIAQLHVRAPATPIAWQLPTANPFLAVPSNAAEHAAWFLRWQLPTAQPRLWQQLDDRLRELIGKAREAGVDLAFSAYDVYWQLSLTGLAAPMSAIVEEALRRLADPAPTSDHSSVDAPPLTPIRQLLKRLPDYNLPAYPAQTDDLAALWDSAPFPAPRRHIPCRRQSPAVATGM